jgi:hypothetical protein
MKKVSRVSPGDLILFVVLLSLQTPPARKPGSKDKLKMGNVNFAPGTQMVLIPGNSSASAYFYAASRGVSNTFGGIFEIQSVRVVNPTGNSSFSADYKIKSGLEVVGSSPSPNFGSEYRFGTYEHPGGSIIEIIDRDTPLWLRGGQGPGLGQGGQNTVTANISVSTNSNNTAVLPHMLVVYKYYRNINFDTFTKNSIGLVNNVE